MKLAKSGCAVSYTHLDVYKRQIHGVTIAWNDLGRNRFHFETQLFRNMRLDSGIDIGKGAHRARNCAGGHILARRNEAVATSRKFGICLCHLETERDRLSVDAGAATNAGRHLVFKGSALDDGQQFVEIIDQNVRCPCQLHGETCVPVSYTHLRYPARPLRLRGR